MDIRQSHSTAAVFNLTAAQITAALPGTDIALELALLKHAKSRVSARIRSIQDYRPGDNIRTPGRLAGTPLTGPMLRDGGPTLINRTAASIVRFMCQFDDCVDRENIRLFDIPLWDSKRPVADDIARLEKRLESTGETDWQNMARLLRENVSSTMYGKSIVAHDEMMLATLVVKPFGLTSLNPILAPPEYVFRNLGLLGPDLAQAVVTKYAAVRPLSRHALCEALAAEMGSKLGDRNRLDSFSLKQGMTLIANNWPDQELRRARRPEISAISQPRANVVPLREIGELHCA